MEVNNSEESIARKRGEVPLFYDGRVLFSLRERIDTIVNTMMLRFFTIGLKIKLN